MVEFKSGKTLRMIASVALIAQCIAMFGIDLLPMSDETNVDEGVFVVLAAVGVTVLISYALSILFFCMWFYRAHKNLAALGIHGLSQTNGMAVGHFFIPFINLFRPRQTATEIWQGSDPTLEADGYSKVWNTGHVPQLISAWWSLWIGSNIGSAFLSNLEMPMVDLIFSALYFASAIACILFMTKVDERQQASWDRIRMKKESVLSETLGHAPDAS